MLFNKELLVFHFISFHFISLILFITLKYKTSGVALFSGSEKRQFVMQKNNLDLSKQRQFWANKKYSIAPVPFGIGLGLSSSLVHILRSLFIQQVCGSVEIQGAAVQITDGYLSTKSLQVAKFARGMGEPLGSLSYQTNFSSVWILRFWFFWSTRKRKF